MKKKPIPTRTELARRLDLTEAKLNLLIEERPEKKKKRSATRKPRRVTIGPVCKDGSNNSGGNCGRGRIGHC